MGGKGGRGTGDRGDQPYLKAMEGSRVIKRYPLDTICIPTKKHVHTNVPKGKVVVRVQEGMIL